MPAPILDDLDCWGKCTECGQILWCEKSPYSQSCGCLCGKLIMVNGKIVNRKGFDRSFKDSDMQNELNSEYLR